MKLATSTNLVCERLDGGKFPLQRTLQLGAAAGFRRFDLCFYDWSGPDSPFEGDQWERWIDGVGEEAARLGVTFGQCHAYTYDFLNPAYSQEERDYREMLMRRSLVCCARLGSTVCVVHPDTDSAADRPMASSARKNRAYFQRLLEDAPEGMELAVENMCDFSIAPRRKFFVTPEEIVDFIDSFGDSRLGVCWDFEHGDIQEIHQGKALRLLGSRLKATHVSDTASKTFEPLMHIMPFFGFTRWEEIMPVLREIGYEGDFSYEAHNYAKRIPEALLPSALRFSYEIGQYLLSLAGEA